MVISHISNVHSLADPRTDSRTVKADGNASEIPKRGMISPGGQVASWNHTRTVDRMSKESGSPTTRDSAIGSPTTRDLATELFEKWRPEWYSSYLSHFGKMYCYIFLLFITLQIPAGLAGWHTWPRNYRIRRKQIFVSYDSRKQIFVS